MALVPIRKRWTRKPPDGVGIDWSHPLAKGLVFFCKMDRFGNQWDIVNNRVGEVYTAGIPGSAVRTFHHAGRWGAAYRQELNTGDDEVGFNFGSGDGANDVYNPAEITIIGAGRPEGTVSGGGDARLVSKFLASSTDAYAIQMDATNLNQIDFRYDDNTGISYPDFSIFRTAGNFVDVDMDFAFACDGGGADGYAWIPKAGEFYSNTGNSAPTALANTSSDLCVGTRSDDRRSWDGVIEYVAIWNHKKTLKEINAFRVNPWQVFQPRMLYVDLATENIPAIYPVRIPWETQPPPGVRVKPDRRLMAAINYNRYQEPGSGDTLRVDVGPARIPGTSDSNPVQLDVVTGGWTREVAGKDVGLQSATGYFRLDGINMDPDGGDFSLLHRVRFNTLEDQGLMGRDSLDFQFQWWADLDTGSLRAAIFDGANTYGSAGDYEVGKTHNTMVTYDASATTLKVFIDGKLVISDTGFASADSNPGQLIWAATDSNGAKIGDPTYFMSAVYGKVLSDREAISLTENPYQIFEPRTVYVALSDPQFVFTGPIITDVANSGETPGAGTETWNDGSTGNVITGTEFL